MKLIKTIYDVACGQGPKVTAWIDGRELVFSAREPGAGRGFLRLTPHEAHVTIAFPRGHELFDPKKRAKGAKGSETRISLRDQADLDLYVRRLIESAHAIDA